MVGMFFELHTHHKTNMGLWDSITEYTEIIWLGYIS